MAARVDGAAEVLDPFRQSSELTREERWRLLLLMLVVFVLNLLGGLLFGLGLLFTMPIAVFAMALVYRRLAARVEEEPAFMPFPAPVPG